MAGDVNVFLTDPEDPHLAEIEVWFLPFEYCPDKILRICPTMCC